MTRAAASLRLPIQHVEANSVGQGEIAAARPHQSWRGDRRCRGARRARRPASARSSRPNTPVAAPASLPRHSSTSTGCRHLHRLQPDRRVPTGEIVGAISVDLSWPKKPEAAADRCRETPRPLPRSSRVSSAAGRRCSRATISPPRSSVVVVTPSSMSASYSFSADDRNCARRVALPMTSGSTPDASGSSVPVWPTLACRLSADAIANGATHDGDDVVRRWPRRLVDNNYAVRKKRVRPHFYDLR